MCANLENELKATARMKLESSRFENLKSSESELQACTVGPRTTVFHCVQRGISSIRIYGSFRGLAMSCRENEI